MLRVALALLVGFAATAASPASQVAVKAGETVTLRLTGSDVSVIERKPSASLSAFEAEQLRNAQGQVVPPGVTAVPGVPVYKTEVPAPSVTPEQLRLTLRKVPGAGSGGSVHTFLTIENGYNQSLVYRAVMHKDNRATPTDVCEVLPHRFGFEHWPYDLDSLELSAFRLVDSSAGEPKCE